MALRGCVDHGPASYTTAHESGGGGRCVPPCYRVNADAWGLPILVSLFGAADAMAPEPTVPEPVARALSGRLDAFAAGTA